MTKIYPMTQPTHFIEVWKNDEGILYYNRYPEDVVDEFANDAYRFATSLYDKVYRESNKK